MDDDFNTADAIAAVFDLVKFMQYDDRRRQFQRVSCRICLTCLVKLTDVLGLIVDKKEEILGC